MNNYLRVKLFPSINGSFLSEPEAAISVSDCGVLQLETHSAHNGINGWALSWIYQTKSKPGWVALSLSSYVWGVEDGQ
jgi:hypothetical protein